MVKHRKGDTVVLKDQYGSYEVVTYHSEFEKEAGKFNAYLYFDMKTSHQTIHCHSQVVPKEELIEILKGDS